MAIVASHPLEEPAIIVLQQIEAILFHISDPHNFAQYTRFRESVRPLSTLLPIIHHAVGGVTVSTVHQNYVRRQLLDVREKLSNIQQSIQDHQWAFDGQKLHPVWLRIFFFTSSGADTLVELPAIALKVSTLYNGPAMEAIRRADSEGTLVDVRKPPGPTMLFSRLKPGLSVLKSTSHRGSIKASDITSQDKIIILFGASGSGKSTFINTAAARCVAEVSASMDPCTRRVQAFRVNDSLGKPVVFIDTPGFDIEDAGEISGIFELTEWLSNLHRRNLFPSGLLCLHNMSANRINPGVSILLQKMCGSSMNIVTFVPTMGTELAEIAREERLQHLEEYWKPYDVTVSPYDDSAVSAWRIVDRMITPRPLKVSSEMSSEGPSRSHLGRTSLGKFLLHWLRMVALLIKKQLTSLKSHWDHLSSMEGVEETLRKKLKAISASLDELNDTVKAHKPVKSTPHFSEHFDDRMDSIHATTYRILFISQLTTELQHLQTMEQHVPTPYLEEALTFFSETLESLQRSERPSIQLFRLLRDLYVLAAVTLDATLQGKPEEPFKHVWAHISEALIWMKPSIQQMNSSNVMSIVSAHRHLASCQQMVGLAYDIFDSPRVRI